MVAKNFEVGDLVWAKMKGFPAWPGKIIDPPADAKSPKQKKPQHYVFFFGSNNHAWILDENIVPHDESMLQTANKKKSGAFQSAVEAIMNHSKSGTKKEKQSDYKDEKEHVIDKDSQKVKVPQTLNNLTPKREGKMIKKIQTKKVSVTKFHRKPVKKRPLPVEENGADSSEASSPSPKANRVDDYDYSDLLANVPPNIRYSDINAIPAYEEDSISQQPSGGWPSHAVPERPVSPVLDIETVTDVLSGKHIVPSSKKIGFLGLGIMGRGMVKNLLNSGHYVTVWNRSYEKCKPFLKAGAHLAQTPADVVAASDITFCCVSDPEASKCLVFGNNGVLRGLDGCDVGSKGYVEMTTIDPETSQAIAAEITIKGARYIEAPINGSRQEAIEGNLIFLVAGDQSLFNDCVPCFRAMGDRYIFISAVVGTASKLNLVHSMLHGMLYAALAEAMALVDSSRLHKTDFLQILNLGALKCPKILEKGKAILEHNYVPKTPLKHMQKDINLALMLGSSCEQPMPIAAATNELYKQCKNLKYSDHDVSAIYQGMRF